MRGRLALGSVIAVLAGSLGLVTLTSEAQGAPVPAGFTESVVFSGLTNPTVVRFSPDGRVFVAEKRGVIKVFDSVTDTTPDVFADLNANVHNFWDRGLLGMALDPNFPASPYVYVLYTYDHVLGSTAPAPRWGTPGVYSDPCPTPPGATADGCVVSGRLSRLTASGNSMAGPEQVLVEDWCQQYPSHSIGTVEFGRSGALYASAGDGASFNFVDWGQDGDPLNPCGDPPGGAGATLTPPTAEGGALRSQDLRTSGDPVGLDGSVIRVDPATGAGLPTEPARYVVRPQCPAHRRPRPAQPLPLHRAARHRRAVDRRRRMERLGGDQPARPVHHPGRNFGWPCYEGVNRQAGYDSANLNICESLYASPGTVTSPYFAYHHTARVVPNESCPTGSSSIAGAQFAFAAGQSPYPTEYDDALFFADYSRDCIWVMPKGADGLPAPGLVRTFVAGAANPVNLQVGPTGELFYVDFDGGTIRRISYASTNRPPVARATATPTTGSAPLSVFFDGSASSDPDAGDTLAFAWDLDGDGAFDDSTSTQPSWTYTSSGTYTATLRVTDPAGATATDAVVISVGNTAPVPVINTPAAGTLWKVGDTIMFSGGATDAQDGALPASALTWDVVIQHCPSNCHSHPMQSWVGVSSGSFVPPDHEAPVYLDLKLTVTDSGGLSTTVVRRLDPRMVPLTFASVPGGLTLTVGTSSTKATFTRNVVVGSSNTVSAVSPQAKGNKQYGFTSWSDGGAQTHTIVAPATATTYTARFK